MCYCNTCKKETPGNKIKQSIFIFLVKDQIERDDKKSNDYEKGHKTDLIELSKYAGETLEILANQKVIAKGEVVVVNEKYGIRLTEIVSPMERVERLG